jgi:hypothetical protein
VILLCALTLCFGKVALAQSSAYPRLANIYLHGFVDPSRIESLARWDLLVLNSVWGEEDLAQLRAIHPDIRLFLYVCTYCVEWPDDPTDAWEQENIAYAEAHDLWWYDSQRAPASDWPGSRMVNITELGSSGPRGSWREFIAARIEALVAARPSLDGVMLDNYWSGISWNQPALQLDSDCNPTHNPAGCDGADSDAVVDSLWNRALRELAADLRTRFDALEPGRGRSLALVGNGASDYHAWLNGSIHEAFPSGWSHVDPGNPYRYNWNHEMFSPVSGYLVAPFADEPYSTNILDSDWSGTVDAPDRSAEFERHKRFTLVSALLGDGYYGLDAGAEGKGVVWWEPEFDHAGRGSGYLGAPLAAMYRVPVALGLEQIRNGSFANGTDGWNSYPFGATGSLQIDTRAWHSAPSAARIDVHAMEQGGEFKLWQSNLPVVEGEGYILRFWARASRALDLHFHLYGEGCPRNICLEEKVVRLDAAWQEYEVPFFASGTSTSGLNLFVRDVGSVWLDDVSLRAGDSSVYRRDFENGTVLLNYTDTTHTLQLNASYRRLDIPGSTVFDGATVTEESVPAWDGRILLRSGALVPPARRGDLHQNEPNPFNPSTRIRFELVEPEHVRLAVYDARGRLVRVLLDRALPADQEHTVSWDGTDRFAKPVRSGTYICRIDTPSFREACKMTLLR